MVRLARLSPSFIAILLALASGAAVAADVWLEVDSGDNVTSYAAPNTIGERAGVKSMWELHDYKAASGGGYLSKVRLVEYDCAGAKSQVAEELSFSENMSKGRLIARTGAVLGNDDKWTAVKPQTVEARMMSEACADPRGGLHHRAYKGYEWLKKFLTPRPAPAAVAVGL